MNDSSGEFAEFLAHVEPRLMSYLHFAACGTADAEDVFQDVCVVAYQNWRRVQKLDRPASWLVRVARNLLITRFTRSARMKRTDRTGEPDAAPAPDVAAGETEARAGIVAAMAALPEEQRHAVSMKIWGGLTWVEIGRILGVSEDTAARLFARGLKALAPKLTGFAP